MLLDEICHHWDTSFGSSSSQPALSTPAAIGIGAGVASVVGVGAYAGWRTVSKWSLRDSGVQVPEFDPSITPTGSRRGGTTPVMGETGDPSEFLSPTPAGRVQKNQRARFF